MKRKKMIWTAGILLGVGLLMKTAGMPESPIVKLKSEAAVSSRETNLSDNETEETAALREQTAENGRLLPGGRRGTDSDAFYR